jgi:hypothetical protein
MMGRWRVERSMDGSIWDELVAFFGAPPALGVFRFELERERFPFIRLVAPDGTVEERARIESLNR